jgi:sugar phosphate isomerase/epimerase
LESLGQPIRQALESAARLGAHGVQVDAAGELAPDQLSQTGRRHLKHLISSYGLELVAIGFPTRRGFDALERLEARVAAAVKTLQLAGALGVPMIVNPLGAIPEERDKHTHFFDAVDTIHREALRVGSRFAIETGWESPQRLAGFLAERDRTGLAINFDAGNLLARGHNVYEAVTALAAHIIGVHVKDVVRTGATVSGFLEVPLGEGEIDWPRLIGELESIGYHGYYTVEREAGENRLRDVTAAVDYLKAVG